MSRSSLASFSGAVLADRRRIFDLHRFGPRHAPDGRASSVRRGPRSRPAPTRRVERAPEYTSGRYSVNVLPCPGALDRRISPPSSLDSSRLMARPRPVPPYLRLVEPSACWKASKMICCLSLRDADAGVGHGEGQHLLRRG